MSRAAVPVRFLLLALFAVALAGCAARQPAEPLPSPGPSAQMPWTAAIGKLMIAGVRPCTAVLVAPDLIVTASHCLHQNGRESAIGDISFAPNLGAEPQLGAFSATEIRAMGGPVSAIHKGSDLIRDWALIGIVPPPRSLAPIQVQALVTDEILARIISGQSLYTAGYGNGHGDVLSRHSPCKVIADTTISPLYAADMLVTSCLILTGDSGGPILLIDQSGRPTLIGIFAGIGLGQSTEKSYGVNASVFVSHLPKPLLSRYDPSRDATLSTAVN